MTPFQQMLLGAGAVAKKTYLDEVFSTYLYAGTGSSSGVDQTIVNGIDLAGEGGLVISKVRNKTYSWGYTDTARGVNKFLNSNNANAQTTTTGNDQGITVFNNNGFTAGKDNVPGIINFGGDGSIYTSSTIRKAPGFFDVVTYTGNGSNRTIAHSLGCKPGLVIVKRTDASDYWNVLHRDIGIDNRLYLNFNSAATSGSSAFWNGTEPTSSVFSVGTDSGVNGNNGTYVAYLFAGGESSAATARSVDFAGGDTDDYLLAPQALITSGRDSNKFCLETWFKIDATSGANQSLYSQYQSGVGGRMILWYDSNRIYLFHGGANVADTGANSVAAGPWYHFAWTYDGTTHRLFLNGTLRSSIAGSSLSADIITNNPRIGGYGAGESFNGQLSNFRVVQGQAVYTSSFRPSTEPLTTTSQGVTGTNCKALLFNNSSVLNNDGAYADFTNPDSGTVTASTDSPFDDPAGFKFGDSKEGIIKCGSYIGNGNADGPEINLGWEPEFILLKDTTSNNSWRIYDSMRGIATGEPDDLIHPDSSAAAYSNGATNEIDLTSTGFKVVINDSGTNSSGSKYVYMTIRRPDGYVQKPVEDATKVFAIATGSGSAYAYTAGFPVDFGWYKAPTQSGSNHWASARLMQGKEFKLNDNVANTSWSGAMFDSSTKWVNATHGSNIQSWMFKRHAGFDVVTYKGNGIAGREIPHSLNKSPEMMWVKSRDSAGNDADWQVYHKGLGQTDNDPEGWNLRLNTNQAENWNNFGRWNKTLPTSTHFTLGNYDGVNKNGDNMIAMLFASVDSISKCGFYSGSSSTQTITTGFQPRFLIIKRTTGQDPWFVLDTTRGWGSGNDNWLALDTNQAQNSADLGAPTSTGFTVNSGSDAYNNTGQKYIYYCHA